MTRRKLNTRLGRIVVMEPEIKVSHPSFVFHDFSRPIAEFTDGKLRVDAR